MAIIFGIDPGTIKLGYGALEKRGDELRLLCHGTLELGSKRSLSERLNQIHQSLRDLILKFPPDYVVIEKVFLGKSADSAFKLGHARGVCLQLAAHSGAEVIELATRSVKKSITGTGSAEKEHVKMVLENLFGETLDNGLDASDALALAVSHAQSLDVLELEKKAFQGAIS